MLESCEPGSFLSSGHFQGYTRSHARDVVTHILPSVVTLVAAAPDDVTVQAALDTVLEVLSLPQPVGSEAGDAAAAGAAAALGDLDALAGLLGALESAEPLLRLTAIQTAGALARLAPVLFDAALRRLGGGARALVAVLDDPLPEIRGEALVLLARVAEHNSELRTLLAFEVRGCSGCRWGSKCASAASASAAG